MSRVRLAGSEQRRHRDQAQPPTQHPLHRRRERLDLDQAARSQLMGARPPGMEGAATDAVMEYDHVTRRDRAGEVIGH